MIEQELKDILKKEGYKGKQLAELLNISYDSYRTMTKKKRKTHPKWIRAFVLGYKLRDLK